MAWYLTLMVVGWWRIRISPSNSQQAAGFSLGCTITMPFLIWLRRTFYYLGGNRMDDLCCTPTHTHTHTHTQCAGQTTQLKWNRKLNLVLCTLNNSSLLTCHAHTADRHKYNTDTHRYVQHTHTHDTCMHALPS